MYHTFTVASAASRATDEDVDQRRISTLTACLECRRKKTRCGGGRPCQQCTWSGRPEACKYSPRGRKAMPSRSLMERLQLEGEQRSTVISRLFPGHAVADLLPLDRDALLQLALSPNKPSEPPASVQASLEDNAQPSPSPSHLYDSQDLATLEQEPELDPAADEVTRRRLVALVIADDVNGLSLPLHGTSSYVGVSSINAILKAIFKVAPRVQTHLVKNHPRTEPPTRVPSPSPTPSLGSVSGADMYCLPPPDVAEKRIDAYFEHIHAMMPMIDEDAFRYSFLYDTRVDVPWLALFNVVLALGSLALGTCDSDEHVTYAERARHILDQRSLGSTNLLILQAYGLLGGYYLHWVSRPNEANAMMGATMRIASAIGLHREYETTTEGSGPAIPREIRRRTWWSLVCLDTWASMTTGRPSFGRVGPGITVAHPILPQGTNNKEYLAALKLLPLVHNISFCTIATRIQDQLATKPFLSLSELAAEDTKLVEWHDNLPPILQLVLPPTHHDTPNLSKDHAGVRGNSFTPDAPAAGEDTCPALLQTPRALMHWWYLTLRFLMHRPYLIAASLCRIPEQRLSPQDTHAIRKCRSLAGQAITCIDQTCQNNLIAGWNAVWLMYQAVMVPLLSLSTLRTSQDRDASSKETDFTEADLENEASEWRAQIQTAINLFQRMSPFSIAATKSKMVVEQLLQACDSLALSHVEVVVGSQPQPQRDHWEGYERGLPGDDLDPGTSAFNVQDPDLSSLWEDMIWEGLPDTFDYIPFTDAHTNVFEE